MNLEDIPPIREEFRKLGEILENARLDRDRKLGSIIRINSAHERTAIDRIQSDWNREQRNYDIAYEELCKKVFGNTMWSIDPCDVLDWIEHFLKGPA